MSSSNKAVKGCYIKLFPGTSKRCSPLRKFSIWGELMIHLPNSEKAAPVIATIDTVIYSLIVCIRGNKTASLAAILLFQQTPTELSGSSILSSCDYNEY
jgi:hypothetical protein